MSLLKVLMATCFDHMFAPACAMDACSDGYCYDLAGPGPDMFEVGVNAFGAEADPSSPVEYVPVFESWDWSSQNAFD
jgi:hypothetical protein